MHCGVRVTESSTNKQHHPPVFHVNAKPSPHVQSCASPDCAKGCCHAHALMDSDNGGDNDPKKHGSHAVTVRWSEYVPLGHPSPSRARQCCRQCDTPRATRTPARRTSQPAACPCSQGTPRSPVCQSRPCTSIGGREGMRSRSEQALHARECRPRPPSPQSNPRPRSSGTPRTGNTQQEDSRSQASCCPAAPCTCDCVFTRCVVARY